MLWFQSFYELYQPFYRLIVDFFIEINLDYGFIFFILHLFSLVLVVGFLFSFVYSLIGLIRSLSISSPSLSSEQKAFIRTKDYFFKSSASGTVYNSDVDSNN